MGGGWTNTCPSPKILPWAGSAAPGLKRGFIKFWSIGRRVLKLQSYFQKVFQKLSRGLWQRKVLTERRWIWPKAGERTGRAAACREGPTCEHPCLALQGCGTLDGAWDKGLNWELEIIPAAGEPERGLQGSRQNGWIWKLYRGTVHPDVSCSVGLAEINHRGILDKYSSFHSGHRVNPHLRLRRMI